MELSALFDGEEHELTPGEEFSGTATGIIRGFTSDPDEDVYGWETPALIPNLIEDPASPWLEENMQGWGAFAIEARRLGVCLGQDMELYQHNLINQDGSAAGRKFTINVKPTERGWRGTRL